MEPVPGQFAAIFKDGFLGDEPVGSSHLVQHICHPVLHSSLGGHWLSEFHDFCFATEHSTGQHFLSGPFFKTQLGNVVEHLKQTSQEVTNVKCYEHHWCHYFISERTFAENVVYLYVCLFCLSVYPFVYLSVRLSLSVALSVP